MPSQPYSLGERVLTYDPSSVLAGPDVAELQVLMGCLGYEFLADATYGPATVEQVRRFQEHRGLLIDGVFGATTFMELSRVRDVLGEEPKLPNYLRDSLS